MLQGPDGYYLSNLEDPREFLASLNIMNHALIPILLTGFHLSLGPHPNQGPVRSHGTGGRSRI